MGDLVFRLVRPLLHKLDAETAHGLTLKALSLGLGGSLRARQWPSLAMDLFGLHLPNPLGLAAGFDKNAEVPDAMLRLGFGFVETGTVTPHPQAGNPRPRLFRLSEDRAVINRMGFNNGGHAAARIRLLKRQSKAGIVGVNLGANKDSDDRMADYEAGIAAFSDLASYLTINISSPNTPGLRGLQSRDELQELLARLNAARSREPRRVPMLLKIAPDLRNDELEDIAACCMGGTVDGVIVSNTTLARPLLRSSHKAETGGLSGRPLLALSTARLANFWLMTQGKVPLIGAGGIADAETAWRKITAGASLLQLYSALVFEGPGLVGRILEGLESRLAAAGMRHLSEAVGTNAHQIASGR
jgi:dihydroorotate dehydrogenase